MRRGLAAAVAAATLVTLAACEERQPCPNGQHWEDHGYYVLVPQMVGNVMVTNPIWQSIWVCAS